MEKQDIPYRRQIFVCTNNRHGEKPSCGDHNGEEVFRRLRAMAKDKGLHPAIRVAQATCLGKCNQGVNIMIYPDNVWYTRVSLEDIAAIANQYIR